MRKKLSISKRNDSSAQSSCYSAISSISNLAHTANELDEPVGAGTNLSQRIFKQTNSPARLVAITSTADHSDSKPTNQHQPQQQQQQQILVSPVDLIERNSKKGFQ